MQGEVEEGPDLFILMPEVLTLQHGMRGRALRLSDTPSSCSERGCPLDEDMALYCQVMNIWILQHESTEGSVPG